MVTMVGLEATFTEALKDLIELEYDAVEAYEATLNRLENKEYIDKMREFMEDHKRHIQDFSAILKQHNEKSIPTGPDASKNLLAKGKVILAGLIGDNALLKAMHSNEIDTNTAYDRLNRYEGRWTDTDNALHKALKDEQRHKAWIESIIGSS